MSAVLNTPLPAVEETAEEQTTDGFHLVIDALKLNGIDTIYGLPGIPITDLTRMLQAEGMRMISFRHEANAGNAAAIAGFITGKPGICLTVSAPGFLNGLVPLANATTNCLPMILISGSSEREIVDLQQGDYEEMDQLAIAKPVCKAAFRVLHAEDIGVGIARAIRAAVSGRPGGVYLDLPAKLFAQTMPAAAGRASLIEVVDPAPQQIPGPDAVARALDLLKSAKKPLIVLGKGAAYARADDDIRASSRSSGIPYLPMSMAKGLLPDTHEQSASAARSFVLPEADVVLLIGARLNWLLSHGKGKTWGGADHKAWGGQKFIQIDISPTEADSNVRDRRAAGRRHRLVRARAARRHGRVVAEAADRMDRRDRRAARARTSRRWPRRWRKDPVADELPQRAERRPRHRQGESRGDVRQRRRERAGLRAQHRRHVQAAQAHRRRHVGRHGHRHGLRGRARPSRPASRSSPSTATARSASPAWRSRRSAATTCRSASSS